MKHSAKIEWMQNWCAANGFELSLEGECGFGRDCVGILRNDHYPDYMWYDEETWERADPNGEVWTPVYAYHKHPCVAVLGHGMVPESQLFDWLVWFDKNGFGVESVETNCDFFGHVVKSRLVKRRNPL